MPLDTDGERRRVGDANRLDRAVLRHAFDDDALAGSSGSDSDGDGGDVPEGAVRFDLAPDEIEAALAAPSLEVEAPDDVDVPDTLVPEERVAELMGELAPRFVPIPGRGDADPRPPPDPATS